MGVTAGWRGTATPKENKEKKTEVDWTCSAYEGLVKLVIEGILEGRRGRGRRRIGMLDELS